MRGLPIMLPPKRLARLLRLEAEVGMLDEGASCEDTEACGSIVEAVLVEADICIEGVGGRLRGTADVGIGSRLIG